jgi:hypothetical protein
MMMMMQDLPGALSSEEVKTALGLDCIQDRHWKIQVTPPPPLLVSSIYPTHWHCAGLQRVHWRGSAAGHHVGGGRRGGARVYVRLNVAAHTSCSANASQGYVGQLRPRAQVLAGLQRTGGGRGVIKRTVMETTRQSDCMKSQDTEGSVDVSAQNSQCHATAAGGEGGRGALAGCAHRRCRRSP